jgi:hypothetical protein
MKLQLYIGILGILAARSAMAQVGGRPTTDTLNAMTLYSACTHPPGETPGDREVREEICTTYIRGLTDGLFMMQVFSDEHRATCLPGNTPISVTEARRIFEQWLREHPESGTNSAAVVVSVAMINAHKCPTAN